MICFLIEQKFSWQQVDHKYCSQNSLMGAAVFSESLVKNKQEIHQ